jgi:hypothetical protein
MRKWTMGACVLMLVAAVLIGCPSNKTPTSLGTADVKGEVAVDGESAYGVLAAGDVQYFKVTELKANTSYAVLCNTNTPVVLSLFMQREDGATKTLSLIYSTARPVVPAYNRLTDEPDDTKSAVVPMFTVTEDSTDTLVYYVSVEAPNVDQGASQRQDYAHFDAQNFALSVVTVRNATTAEDIPTASASVRVGVPKWYKTSALVKNTVYKIDVATDWDSLTITVLMPDGQTNLVDETADKKIAIKPTKDGVYYIKVKLSENTNDITEWDSAPFTLAISPEPADEETDGAPKAITIGAAAVTGNIHRAYSVGAQDPTKDIDSYSFTPAVGKAYQVTLTPTGFDMQLSVNGATIFKNADGTYKLPLNTTLFSVSATGSTAFDTGSYTVALSEQPTGK